MIASLRAAMIAVPLVFGPALALEYQPTILVVDFADGQRIEIAATSPDVCAAAVRAIRIGWWRVDDGVDVASLACVPGDRFVPGSDTIAGFNGPGVRP